MSLKKSWRTSAVLSVGLGASILPISFSIFDAAFEPVAQVIHSGDSHPGSIRGSVKIESKIQPRSLAVNLYSRRGIARAVHDPPTPVNELETVVLYLQGPFRNFQPTSLLHPAQRNRTIQQVNETFIPHVLPLLVGTTVDFPNGDPFFHNVFSLSSAKSFDLGRYPKNQVRSVKFDRPGVVKVFCHIHSHMSATILVFDHPYFCVSDGAGRFFMNAVPPGVYTLVAWHERLKPLKKSVTISPGNEVRVDIVL